MPRTSGGQDAEDRSYRQLRALRTELKRTWDSITSEETAAATPLAAFPAPVAAGLRLYMNGASGAVLTRGGGGIGNYM